MNFVSQFCVALRPGPKYRPAKWELFTAQDKSRGGFSKDSAVFKCRMPLFATRIERNGSTP